MTASHWTKLSEDIDAWQHAAGSKRSLRLILRLVLLEPGFQLVLSLRLQEALRLVPLVGGLLGRLLWYATTIMTGCHIAPGARLGGGLYIPHPTGIVIGRHSVVGRNVTIYQQVTLGERRPGETEQPLVENGCLLGAGAKILGGVRIGADARVGANAVVLEDVPSGGIAVGIHGGGRGAIWPSP